MLVTVRRDDQRSSPSTPNSKILSVMKRRPSTDRCAYEDLSYLPSRVMKRAAEEIAQVWDDGVHDGPSWPRWSVVTTTIHHEVRRSSRVWTDFQLIESLFD